jgi:catechol 2,3-dioxygenase-like lactoylglutathione lyase family enzyme
MLGSSDLVAFVAAANLETAHRFYSGVLGLEVVEQTDFDHVYRVNGSLLRVIKTTPVPAPYTVVGWIVEDLDATGRALEALGVEFLRYDGMEQDERGIMREGGPYIAWFADPAGNVLSVLQER